MKEKINNPSVSTQQASTPPPVDTYVPSFQPGAPTPRYFSKRTALIVLAIIFTVAISYGIFFAISTYTAVTAPHDSRVISNDIPTVTPNPTADWKVHKNEQLGIEFKYPPTFVINEKINGGLGIASSEAEFNEMGRFIDIHYSNKNYDDTVAEVIKFNDLMKHQDDIKDIVETNDKKTTETTGPYNSSGAKDLYTKVIFWKYRNGALIAFYTDVNKKEASVYDQILSTIKFDNQNTQAVTKTPAPSQEQVACTDEAMQCPDGSYVGRSGPKCEFVCPK
jgi:hypothetical protein